MLLRQVTLRPMRLVEINTGINSAKSSAMISTTTSASVTVMPACEDFLCMTFSWPVNASVLITLRWAKAQVLFCIRLVDVPETLTLLAYQQASLLLW